MGEDKKIADKTDCSVAFAVGALTSSLDVLWTNINLQETSKLSNEKLQKTAEQIVKILQPKIGNSRDAIKYLQQDNIAPVQKLESAISGGIKKKIYNLADQSSTLGLVFGILSQFSGKSFGIDEDGVFHAEDLAKEELAGTPVEKIYNASISWIVHMAFGISDRKNPDAVVRGTEVPAPLQLIFKEAAEIPYADKLLRIDVNGDYSLANLMTQLLEGKYARAHEGENVFDLSKCARTPEALSKQMVPVIINECIVRAFYAFRRFTIEIQKLDKLTIEAVKQIDQNGYLPFNSDALTHMLMLANLSFSSVDMAAGLGKAIVQNKGKKNTKIIVADFLKEINYAGLIRLTLNASVEYGPKLEAWTASCQENIDRCKDAIAESISENEDVVRLAEKAGDAALGVAEATTPTAIVFGVAKVYEEIKKAEEERAEAREERIRIEEACDISIRVLEEYQAELSEVVSGYLEQHIEVFNTSVEAMEQAIVENDADKFIDANVQIQQQLGYDTQFTTTDEFDELMNAVDSIKI